jgi:AcrR family transcriptional regulator
VSGTGVRGLRRDAARNRARIVAAARGVFAAEGVEVSVEEIARRASVGMGTLYRHFPTKDELIDAVLEEALGEICAAAEAALEHEDTWMGFRGFLERVFELHVQNRGLKVALAGRGQGRVESARARMRPLVAELVARAQADGSLRSDLAPEDVPVVLWSGGRVAELTVSVAPDLWRRFLGFLLDGLRADAATPLPGPPLSERQVECVAEARHR